MAEDPSGIVPMREAYRVLIPYTAKLTLPLAVNDALTIIPSANLRSRWIIGWKVTPMIRLPTAAVVPMVLLAQPVFALCGEMPMPPPQFDFAPTRDFYDDREEYRRVDGICRHFANFAYQTNRLEGCVFKVASDDIPTRVIPNDISARYTDCLIEHENGHLNGWGANHPDPRYR